MAGNGNFKLIGFIQQNTQWILAVIIIPILFFMAKGIIANDEKRANEDIRISDKAEKADEKLQFAFLAAIEKVIAEQRANNIEVKADNKEIKDKLSAVITDVAVIKQEVKKK